MHRSPPAHRVWHSGDRLQPLCPGPCLLGSARLAPPATPHPLQALQRVHRPSRPPTGLSQAGIFIPLPRAGWAELAEETKCFCPTLSGDGCFYYWLREGVAGEKPSAGLSGQQFAAPPCGRLGPGCGCWGSWDLKAEPPSPRWGGVGWGGLGHRGRVTCWFGRFRKCSGE